MTTALPEKPDLGLLKKQAKKLLKQFRESTGNDAHQLALATIQQYHPKPQTFNSLRDAQYVIARSYNYQDWNALSEAVEVALLKLKSLTEQVEIFIHQACLHYDGEDNAVKVRRARQMLKQNRAIGSHDFYSAVVSNNADAVSVFLNDKTALATAPGGPLNWPPLHYATYSRIENPSDSSAAVKIVSLLLDKGADPSAFILAQNTYRFAALTGAMGEGEGGIVHQSPHKNATELAHLLLKAGANPNDAQGLYNTIFADTSLYWVKLLMDYGLNADHRIDWDQSDDSQYCFDFLLAYAVKNGYQDRVEFLLDAGASPDTLDGYDKRSIHSLALIMGYPEIAALLAARGASTEEPTEDDRFKQAIANNNHAQIDRIIDLNPACLQNPEYLHHAAMRGSVETVRHLIADGYDINGRSKDGRILLHVYAWEDDVDTVRYLVENGADTNAEDYNHRSTPLGHATYNGAFKVIRYLRQFCRDIFEMVLYLNLEGCKRLLAEDPTLIRSRSQMGNTLLHAVGAAYPEEADEKESAEIIDHLLSLGMDINTLSNSGITPLDFALQNDNELLTGLLEERGGISSK